MTEFLETIPRWIIPVIYFIGLFITAVIVKIVGVADANNEGDYNYIIIAWPLALAMLCILGPFVLIFRLADMLGDRVKKDIDDSKPK